jgi:Cytochrome C and Quinol oxidase polypeptide I
VVYRAAHIHMLLLGFVTGMIFGVGYHVFPRFAARPLASPRLMRLHWWLANAGVAAMAVAFALRAPRFRGVRSCLVLAGHRRPWERTCSPGTSGGPLAGPRRASWSPAPAASSCRPFRAERDHENTCHRSFDAT